MLCVVGVGWVCVLEDGCHRGSYKVLGEDVSIGEEGRL